MEQESTQQDAKQCHGNIINISPSQSGGILYDLQEDWDGEVNNQPEEEKQSVEIDPAEKTNRDSHTDHLCHIEKEWRQRGITVQRRLNIGSSSHKGNKIVCPEWHFLIGRFNRGQKILLAQNEKQ